MALALHGRVLTGWGRGVGAMYPGGLSEADQVGASGPTRRCVEKGAVWVRPMQIGRLGEADLEGPVQVDWQVAQGGEAVQLDVPWQLRGQAGKPCS